jgi:hypothetical protein
LINGKDGSRRHAELVDFSEDVNTRSFSVCGTLRRAAGQMAHDFAIASLRKDIVVYVERLRVPNGCRIDSRETGVVGHEYPLDSNTRAIFGAFGRREIVGLGNPPTVHEWETDWLNLGGHVGYVVRRQATRENVMRYHDQSEGQGRVPKLQEWFSLVGDADSGSDLVGEDWACIVTFLNQTPDETERWASQIQFQVEGDAATCSFGADEVRSDFRHFKVRVVETPTEK